MYGVHMNHVVHRRGIIDNLGGVINIGSDVVSNSIPPISLPTQTLPPVPSQSVPGTSSQVESLSTSVLPLSGSSSVSSSSTSSTVSTLSSIPSSSSPSPSLLSPPSLTSSSPQPSPPPVSPLYSSDYSTYLSSSNGHVVVVTSFVNATPDPSKSAVAPPPKSFLQNKSLSGGVFSAIGVVVVIIAVIFITTCVRKRTRDRLHNQAATLSFDPRDVEDRISNEKLSYSGSHSGHGHTHGDPTSFATTAAPMPNAVYVRQDYGNSYGVINPGYNIMPNPHTTYGNSAYQVSRLASPMYGAGATGNGYNINAAANHAQTRFSLNDSSAPAPPIKGESTARIPPPPPLPDTFGDDDIYGGITSIDRLEENARIANLPRALHVANK